MPSSMNMADPRVRRTRQLILVAFKELLQKQSFRDITVGDIADQATINRGTFYDHFTDKFALLDQFMREEMRAYLAASMPNQQWSATNLAVLARAILDFVSFVFHQCHPGDREFESIAQAVLVEEVAAIVQTWLYDPHFPQRLGVSEADAVATTWSWSIYGMAMRWNSEQSIGSSADIAARLTRLLLGTVTGATGRAIIP
jgi:AcrR family transcriptional regulator